MKKETVIKKLKHYAKSLQFMETEARNNGEGLDAEHYMTDKLAMLEAIKLIEREGSNT